jgi:glutamate formiminotransferase
VPNVSAGRDPGIVSELAASVRVAGVRLLDVHSDPDHDRTVLTIAGRGMALAAGLLALAEAGIALIDMRRQRGVHPRLGGLDVVPIVRRSDDDEMPARSVAGDVAMGVGDLGIPVFLYGDIAADPERSRPHQFRDGGLEGMAARLDAGDEEPDFGPHHAHPTAGVTLVGVRGPLVAWNVPLEDGGLTEARVIAARVRERGGGLTGVRALGLPLIEQGTAQVSMNLEEPAVVGPAEVVARVRAEAERIGATPGNSELVGLISKDAIRGATLADLGLERFEPRQLVEAHVPRGS